METPVIQRWDTKKTGKKNKESPDIGTAERKKQQPDRF